MGRRATVSLARLLLGDSVSLWQDDWYETLWDDDHSQCVSQYSLALPAPRRACAAHLASASLRRLPFPQRVRRVLDLPLL
jgi:hypothetical protein